ncbi:acetyl-CoA carboxylase biotin carboxylase [Seminavis robusta]|uniref:Acetyl-CoA carboxylase biotin carboxylase n=1 Tax=Seminavis robusta TaxID=568900 RepID=A0A9N8D996_9STRA|nr:acetyl-CoA carboxylase biotin carboxylase [Seminavis robusta]|eukprot:Sro6_g005170.1 acetyl-CoA carboxylase biotin carboxylase (459) ;mRNA; f:117967-119343
MADQCNNPRGVIVLLDPVTEWKAVLDAAVRLGYLVIGVQLSPIPEAMRAFFPTTSMLEDAGASRALDRQDRDVFSCVQALMLAVEELQTDKDIESLSIRAMIPLSETGVDFSDTISAMLGLTNHNPLDSVLCRRDKGFMKQAVAKQSGLQVAKFARIGKNAQRDLEAKMDALSLEYPVVIKTPQGFSTKDVYICTNLDDARTALTNIFDNQGPDGRAAPCALLEEYIGGTEFAVNLLASRKNQTGAAGLIVTDVWVYDKTNTARYNGAEMCDPNDPTLKEICDYAKGVARAVGIEYGAAHVEIKAKQISNPKDIIYTHPVMMEIGARLSGGRKAIMTQAAYQNQWDPFEALIQSHLGELDDTTLSSPPLHVYHMFLPVEKAGRIKERNSILDDTGKADNPIETLHSHFWLAKVGDHVQETTDITSCAGFVWLVGEKSKVRRDATLILDSFKLETEDEA